MNKTAKCRRLVPRLIISVLVGIYIGPGAAQAGAIETGAPIALIFARAHRNAGAASSGTATAIAKGQYGYWLTADHVTGSAPFISIHRPDGRRWAGRVVARDGQHDLALVQTSVLEMPEPIRVWTAAIDPERWYHAEGFAGAKFSGFGRRKGRFGRAMSRMIQFLLPSIPGDSGGCMYTVYGGKRYQCSVTSGSNWPEYRSINSDGYTFGASPRDIRSFLKSAGLTVERSGQVSCLRQALGGRFHPDPLQQQYQQQVIPLQQAPPQQYQLCPPGGQCDPQQPPQQPLPQQPLPQQPLPQQPQPVTGPPGPAGPMGPPGERGPSGPKGDPAQLNYEALLSMIKQDLPRSVTRIELRNSELIQKFSDGSESVIGDLGFTLEMYNNQGNKTDSERIPNNGVLKLQTLIRGN